MCLQVLFFAPVNLLSPQQSFARFTERLIVSPVVRVLVFSKVRSPKQSANDSIVVRIPAFAQFDIEALACVLSDQ